MFEGPDMFPDGGGKVLGLDEARPPTRAGALATITRLEREIGAVRPTAVNLAAALRLTAAAAETTAGDPP